MEVASSLTATFGFALSSASSPLVGPISKSLAASSLDPSVITSCGPASHRHSTRLSETGRGVAETGAARLTAIVAQKLDDLDHALASVCVPRAGCCSRCHSGPVLPACDGRHDRVSINSNEGVADESSRAFIDRPQLRRLPRPPCEQQRRVRSSKAEPVGEAARSSGAGCEAQATKFHCL